MRAVLYGALLALDNRAMSEITRGRIGLMPNASTSSRRSAQASTLTSSSQSSVSYNVERRQSHTCPLQPVAHHAEVRSCCPSRGGSGFRYSTLSTLTWCQLTLHCGQLTSPSTSWYT